jgi:hypothetical protein
MGAIAHANAISMNDRSITTLPRNNRNIQAARTAFSPACRTPQSQQTDENIMVLAIIRKFPVEKSFFCLVPKRRSLEAGVSAAPRL